MQRLAPQLSPEVLQGAHDELDHVDAAAIAPDHVGEKVAVRGEVRSVDVSDPEDCVVEHCEAESGGGVSCSGGTFLQNITRSTFSGRGKFIRFSKMG